MKCILVFLNDYCKEHPDKCVSSQTDQEVQEVVTHKLEMSVTQSSVLWYLDGKPLKTEYNHPSHNTYESVACYADNPDPEWDVGRSADIDVVISNLVIKDESECSFTAGIEDAVSGVSDGMSQIGDELTDIVEKIDELPEKIAKTVTNMDPSKIMDVYNDEKVRELAETLKSCNEDLVKIFPVGYHALLPQLAQIPFIDLLTNGDGGDDIIYILMSIPILESEEMTAALNGACEALDIVTEARDDYRQRMEKIKEIPSGKVVRERLSKKECAKDSDNLFCLPSTVDWSIEEYQDMDTDIDTDDVLQTAEAVSVSLEKLAEYRETKLSFGILVRMLGEICKIMPDPFGSVCQSIGSAYVTADAVLDVVIQIIEMHESVMQGRLAETAEFNTEAIIKNQLALRDLIESAGIASAPAAPVAVKKPNTIQFEMSIEDLVMKGAMFGFVCILFGLLIGYCVWNTGKSSYNPVKFVDEKVDEETDCEL